MTAWKSIVAASVVAVLAGSAGATVIYSDDFSGSAGTLLNGQPEDAQGTLWAANNFVNADGSINGANEGSALLPFEPAVNKQYVLKLDVRNTSDRWVALGFARDPLASPGASNLNDRLSNETEGIAWMLYRNNNANNAIETFTGLRTAGGAAHGTDAANNGILTALPNTLEIHIDTTGDGSSFAAQWYVSGFLLRSANIALNIDDINYVGFAFDNSTTIGVQVDNFSLTLVPEPATLGLVAAAGLLGLRRRA